MSKQKVRIILPGGGIRGCFQCGFAKAMQDSNLYEIDFVYGTSVGAILAPFIANNRIDEAKDLLFSVKNINDIVQEYTSIAWLNYFLRPIFALFNLSEFTKFTLVDKALKALGTDAKTYEKCKCVAWDYYNKKKLWFSGENYPIGMRGSSALFLAVPPVKYMDTYLVDGGCVSNIPLTEEIVQQKDQKDDYDGLYILLDCNTDSPFPTTTSLHNNGLVFSYSILADATRKLLQYERDEAKTALTNKLIIIEPGFTYKDDVFENALDIDPVKMEKSYNLGIELFDIFHETTYIEKMRNISIIGKNIMVCTNTKLPYLIK